MCVIEDFRGKVTIRVRSRFNQGYDTALHEERYKGPHKGAQGSPALHQAGWNIMAPRSTKSAFLEPFCLTLPRLLWPRAEIASRVPRRRRSSGWHTASRRTRWS